MMFWWCTAKVGSSTERSVFYCRIALCGVTCHCTKSAMERSENQIAINNEMLNDLVISHELYASWPVKWLKCYNTEISLKLEALTHISQWYDRQLMCMYESPLDIWYFEIEKPKWHADLWVIISRTSIQTSWSTYSRSISSSMILRKVDTS